ncbi:endocytosis defective- protein [Entomortierella beljakovae]|nr:endocytosis defective- protein [Entomortierella beljakovae]
MDMSQAELQKYAEIFQSLNPVGGYITGVQARNIFMSSGLHVAKLGQIWDLCDIDKDGNMDFDEFCLALRFMYASINNEISDIPQSLPPHLIPQSKAHYFGGNQGYNQSYLQQAQPTGYQGSQSYGQQQQQQNANYASISDLDSVNKNLSDDFDWYIAPNDRNNYESIYRNHVQLSSGEVRMNQFEDLYQALGIPRDDIHAAWSLVNVHSAPQIGKDQCIQFFHILNSRRLGKRVPKTLPGALRTSFLGDSNYTLSNEIGQQAGRPSVPLSFATKSAFSSHKGHAMADDYLSRLNQKDVTTNATHAQEDRLKHELEDIKRRIDEAELRANPNRGDLNIVKKELKEFLEYKQQQVLNDDPSILNRQMLDQEREIQRQRDALKQLDKVMQGLREQKDLIETHIADSENELRESEREVEKLRNSRIPQNATKKEIKTQFYKLSKLHHPDKNTSEASRKEFLAINDAYSVLGNERQRRDYDLTLLDKTGTLYSSSSPSSRSPPNRGSLRRTPFRHSAQSAAAAQAAQAAAKMRDPFRHHFGGYGQGVPHFDSKSHQEMHHEQELKMESRRKERERASEEYQKKKEFEESGSSSNKLMTIFFIFMAVMLSTTLAKATAEEIDDQDGDEEYNHHTGNRYYNSRRYRYPPSNGDEGEEEVEEECRSDSKIISNIYGGNEILIGIINAYWAVKYSDFEKRSNGDTNNPHN